jgi:hypothetical protein
MERRRLTSIDELIIQNDNAERLLRQYAPYYHALEGECPKKFKAVMLLNDWHSPFIAVNELLKRIDINDKLIKCKTKKEGVKVEYKSHYKELRAFVQECVNKREAK